VNYGVKIATTTTASYEAGEWDGYAWSENIGWISFNCKPAEKIKQISAPLLITRFKIYVPRVTGIKIDLTLQYNSSHPEQQITRTNSFVFNILTPSK